MIDSYTQHILLQFDLLTQQWTYIIGLTKYTPVKKKKEYFLTGQSVHQSFSFSYDGIATLYGCIVNYTVY